jgi:ATP-dependent DNA helicase RecG
MRSLIFLREMGAIDNAAYRNLNHVDTLAASTSLRRLREHRLLDAKGSGSRTYYVPSADFNELSGQVSMHSNALTMHVRRAIDGASSSLTPLPEGLARRVAMLGKRVDPQITERLIEAICTWQPTSADDIARYLGRTKQHVSNKYLYRMVREGRLNYAYPNMVKHPGQKLMIPSREDFGDA